MTETATPTLIDPPLKRCAIVGTAPSWKQTPFHDPNLHIFGLNDAYSLGQPRADAWFDLHPVHRWFMYDRAHMPTIDQVPPGTYLRPQGHRDWLRTRPFPVFLLEAQADIPTSQRFPREQVLEFWKPYWPYRVQRDGTVTAGGEYTMSSPAWMYLWAVANGYREIHIYGIHLSTEWEYLRQRPNLEFLMGVGAGLGVKHVLPASTPLCRADFEYGYDLKPDVIAEPTQRRIDAARFELQQIAKARARVAWWDRARRADLDARQAVVDVELLDAQLQLKQLQQKVA